jgi:uncharacterized repeat protein (TIGR01451 family)
MNTSRTGALIPTFFFLALVITVGVWFGARPAIADDLIPGSQQGASSIGDRVWNDLNANGLQEPGEPGINGVRVELYQDLNCDGALDAGDAFQGFQITGANPNVPGETGWYTFAGVTLGPGFCYLVYLPPSNFAPGQPLEDYSLTFSYTEDNGVYLNPAFVFTPDIQADIKEVDFGFVRTGLRIDKTPDYQMVLSGSTVTFTITVSNTGTLTLTNAAVTDALAPNCVRQPLGTGILPPGAGTSYTCTAVNVTQSFTNVATLTGVGPNNTVLTDSDDAQVQVITPAIDIQKAPDNQTVVVNGNATFTITVTNTGNVQLTNVTVTDPQVPTCATVVGNLGVGASTSFVCTALNVSAGFTNTAFVSGQTPIGGTVNDQDTARVDVVRPGIDIQKTPDNQIVVAGSMAVFTITVTNTGDVPLQNVTVTDVQAPGCARSVGSLGVGASSSYTCTVAGVAADFTNTATVTGTDSAGNQVTDNDSAAVDVIRPGIEVLKNPDNQVVLVGGTANFTITVRNTGDVPLVDVDLVDPLAPNCSQNNLSLAVGGTFNYVCSVSPVTVGFTNVITATGTDSNGNIVTDDDTAPVTVVNPAIDIQKSPDIQTVFSGGTATFTITVQNTGDVDLVSVVISDTLAPDCARDVSPLAVGQVKSYTCTVANVTSDFTNVATVTGTDGNGNQVTDTDDAFVDVTSSQIRIVKSPDLQTVVKGGTVTFTISVTNTGQAVLTNVIVTDTLAPTCNNATIGNLNPGQSVSYQCSTTANSDFTNVANVTGTPPEGPPVGDSDSAVVDVLEPGIQVQKTPDQQYVISETTATFTITVVNTGQVTLTAVTAVDPAAPACNRSFSPITFPVGASFSYTCTVLVTQSFTNVVTVTGTDNQGNQATDDDDARVDEINPGIDVQKTPDLQLVPVGSSARFTITVTNTGDTVLTDVIVSDPVAPACTSNIGTLAAGQSVTYTCTLANVTADFVNVATATGKTPAGGTVTDDDNASVDAINPALVITKKPDLQTVTRGSTVTFTISVTNTGDVILTNVTVGDTLAPTCAKSLGTLAPGQSTSYVCTVADAQATFTNVAVVTGADPTGRPVTDNDDAVAQVVNPGIDVRKTPDLQKVKAGSTVTFTIVVTNTGDVALKDVVVSDPLAPNCARTIASLPAGASTSFNCTVANVTADFVNVVTVIGTPVDSGGNPLPGAPVTDTDDAEVDALNPGVEVQKTVYLGHTAGAGCPGSETVSGARNAAITYCFAVRNTGDTYLTAIQVNDPALGITVADLTVKSGTVPLAPGASLVYYYEATIQGDLTNTATTTAQPSEPNGTPIPGVPPVTDDDTATVDEIRLGAIGDLVWLDQNLNGLQDPGEPGVPGVTVKLFDGSGNLLATTMTDVDGFYSFNNLAAGNYRVQFVPAAGYSFTLADQGSDDKIDSDADPTTGFTAVITLLAGQINPNIDAGLWPLDFGDLPDEDTATNSPSYNTTIASNGPRHKYTAALRMGALVDSEVDGQSNATATGDDTNPPGSADDEEGVTLPTFKAGETALVPVRVRNQLERAATLYGFIDMNGDGDFADRDEVVKTTVPAGTDGTVNLTFNVPSNAESALKVGARFRLSTADNLGPDGVAPDGEVGDYLIEIVAPTLIELARFVVTPGDGYNDIFWETTLELNTLGFLIYRGTDDQLENAVQISRNRIPPTGSTGGEYTFRDDVAVQTGVEYFYWLIEVEQAADGGVNLNPYGPFRATNNFNKPNSGTGQLYLPLITR